MAGTMEAVDSSGCLRRISPPLVPGPTELSMLGVSGNPAGKCLNRDEDMGIVESQGHFDQNM
jgi:hypothetical protein